MYSEKVAEEAEGKADMLLYVCSPVSHPLWLII